MESLSPSAEHNHIAGTVPHIKLGARGGGGFQGGPQSAPKQFRRTVWYEGGASLGLDEGRH